MIAQLAPVRRFVHMKYSVLNIVVPYAGETVCTLFAIAGISCLAPRWSAIMRGSETERRGDSYRGDRLLSINAISPAGSSLSNWLCRHLHEASAHGYISYPRDTGLTCQCCISGACQSVSTRNVRQNVTDANIQVHCTVSPGVYWPVAVAGGVVHWAR